jgi:hypothetical protein
MLRVINDRLLAYSEPHGAYGVMCELHRDQCIAPLELPEGTLPVNIFLP